MNNLWHIHGLPVHLLMWLLKQSWCLGQSPEGVVTIGWAMHPGQLEWRLDAIPPVQSMEDMLRCKTYVFAVNHADHTIRFCRVQD